jgi:hypothetical protein
MVGMKGDVAGGHKLGNTYNHGLNRTNIYIERMRCEAIKTEKIAPRDATAIKLFTENIRLYPLSELKELAVLAEQRDSDYTRKLLLSRHGVPQNEGITPLGPDFLVGKEKVFLNSGALNCIYDRHILSFYGHKNNPKINLWQQQQCILSVIKEMETIEKHEGVIGLEKRAPIDETAINLFTDNIRLYPLPKLKKLAVLAETRNWDYEREIFLDDDTYAYAFIGKERAARSTGGTVGKDFHHFDILFTERNNNPKINLWQQLQCILSVIKERETKEVTRGTANNLG